MSDDTLRRSCDAVPIVIVGAFGGTHIGSSFARAARELGYAVVELDVADAMRGARVLRALSRRFFDRRPLRLRQFAAMVEKACPAPALLISTGLAPLPAGTLERLGARGVICVNYSTDDPWNRVHRADWHLKALRHFDIVFTPRSSNIIDFQRLGCGDVRYLAFGYDDNLFGRDVAAEPEKAHHVLFIGGADRDRVAFISELIRRDVPVAVAGVYWNRYRATRPFSLGLRSPADLQQLTAAAKVNLCLVRRANRDGHVMRTFEAAAMGACMVVEYTEEHRAIFGRDGECVRYFKSAGEAACVASHLLADASERARLSASVRERISGGEHTYRHRLKTIVDTALNARARACTAG